MQSINNQLKILETGSITFGNQLGRGGEGSVFSIINAPDLAIKIYHNPLTRDKSDKLHAMVRLKNERLLNLTTWPLATYHTANSQVSGFIMRQLEKYCPLYELYNPKLRLQKFPQADWRFLIYTASNIARAFEVIHDAGHVVGDVNHGNLVVARDATIRFIDTDSFQIMDRGKFWHCEVGVSTHQPPEMQGISFKGVTRTPNHDNFGLAVIVFQLLFLGRHPFAGRFQESTEMPLEKAIIEHRFAFSSNIQRTQMLPPPACLTMNALPPDIKNLFERAFSKEGVGSLVGLRPTPNEWVTSLTELVSSVKTCNSNAGHYYWKNLGVCPWCEIENLSGLKLFPVVSTMGKVKTIIHSGIDEIWRQVEAIPDLGPEPMPPDLRARTPPPTSTASKAAEQLKNIKKWLFIFFGLIFCCVLLTDLKASLLFITAIFSICAFDYYRQSDLKGIKDKLISKHKLLLAEWNNLINEWKEQSLKSNLDSQRQYIKKLKSDYDDVGTDRDYQFQELNNKLKQEQLKNHLKQYSIANANIQGIGSERLKELKNHGIITAADIQLNQLQNVKGFGDVFCNRLINWKQRLVWSFAYHNLTNQYALQLEETIKTRRRALANELSTAVAQLTNITAQIHNRRQNLSKKSDALIEQYSQIMADSIAVGLNL